MEKERREAVARLIRTTPARTLFDLAELLEIDPYVDANRLKIALVALSGALEREIPVTGVTPHENKSYP